MSHCQHCEGRHWLHSPDSEFGVVTCRCLTALGADLAPSALYVQHAHACGCSEMVCPTCGDMGYVDIDEADGRGEHCTKTRPCGTCHAGLIR